MDDEKIVTLYWNRDERAIPATADKYGHYCTSIARNILRNHEDAEECVNDTYLNAWNAMPPHRPGVLAAFLGKITRNLSLNRYHYAHAQKRGGSEFPAILDELAECVSGSEQVESELERKELVSAINEFLAALPAEKRALFVRRYWYCDSVSDLAVRMGRTANNISVTLNRLRQQLQRSLHERGFEL